jgi:hypothetical protein
MKKTERILYNYLLPRSKRELTNYVHAILGIPALTLFVLSFYIGMREPWYLLLSVMGLFFSRQFIYTLWSYFKYENFFMCLAIDLHAVGFGFEHDNIEFWMFIDGIYALELEDDNWWVIRHNSGTWLYFPNGLLSEEDIRSLKNKISDANK